MVLLQSFFPRGYAHSIAAIFTAAAVMFFTSCGNKVMTVISNVNSAYYATEAYNSTFGEEKIHLFSNKTPYATIPETGAQIIISDSAPPAAARDLLQPAREMRGTLIDMGDKKTTLIAFSVPLIVTLRTNNTTLPDNRAITLNQLQKLVHATPASPEKNTWAFPFASTRPEDTSFKRAFATQENYTKWINTIPGVQEQALFATHYTGVPFLAMLQDENIAYKFVPSHIFFEQPISFRNKFLVAVLTDNKGNTPIVDPVFISVTNQLPLFSKQAAKKFVSWIMKSKSQKDILTFTSELFINTPAPTQFLDRNYSNNALISYTALLAKNKWLATYGPRLSTLYINPEF